MLTFAAASCKSMVSLVLASGFAGFWFVGLGFEGVGAFALSERFGEADGLEFNTGTHIQTYP